MHVWASGPIGARLLQGGWRRRRTYSGWAVAPRWLSVARSGGARGAQRQPRRALSPRLITVGGWCTSDVFYRDRLMTG